MSHKPLIVVADGFDPNLFSKLTQIEELNVVPKPKLTQEELQEYTSKMNGIIIRSQTKMTQELIDQCPELKYIIRAGEGTDNIDKAYCKKKGIKVSNTPGANNNSAAEHAIALMLTVLRKTAWAHTSMSQGLWEKSKYMGNELTNKTVGIVGFGRIGQLVAKRLKGFEPNVLFYDPFVNETSIPEAKKVNDLATLFKKSDIISIHLPLNKQTENLINADLLNQAQNHAILINASRGNIVNETDLYQSLKEGKIRGAGFDVFGVEPLEKESPLRNLDNIVFTPHLGGSTTEAQYRVGEMALYQIKEFFINKNLVNEVRE